MPLDIKEKWGKIRSIGGMSPSKEKDAATNKWFEEGEFKDWLVKLENSLPQQVPYCNVLYCNVPALTAWHDLQQSLCRTATHPFQPADQ